MLASTLRLTARRAPSIIQAAPRAYTTHADLPVSPPLPPTPFVITVNCFPDYPLPP